MTKSVAGVTSVTKIEKNSIKSEVNSEIKSVQITENTIGSLISKCGISHKRVNSLSALHMQIVITLINGAERNKRFMSGLEHVLELHQLGHRNKEREVG